MRQVTINRAMNGFIVNVGCQTLVFQAAHELLLELGNYLVNPEQVEKIFVERFGMQPSSNGVGQTLPPPGYAIGGYSDVPPQCDSAPLVNR